VKQVAGWGGHWMGVRTEKKNVPLITNGKNKSVKKDRACRRLIKK